MQHSGSIPSWVREIQKKFKTKHQQVARVAHSLLAGLETTWWWWWWSRVLSSIRQYGDRRRREERERERGNLGTNTQQVRDRQLGSHCISKQVWAFVENHHRRRECVRGALASVSSLGTSQKREGPPFWIRIPFSCIRFVPFQPVFAWLALSLLAAALIHLTTVVIPSQPSLPCTSTNTHTHSFSPL